MVTTISIIWGIITMLEKEGFTMKIYKVDIRLKNRDHLETGWFVGRTAVEVANEIRTQPTVLLVSSYRELAATGYNMSEVQGISGYNSSEIVKYHVQEYEVIPCSIK